MAFGSQISQELTGVNGTEQFFSGITHDSYFSGSWVGVTADYDSNNTGEITARLYTSGEDNGLESWDTTALIAFSIASTDDPNKVSLAVQGVYRWRIGVTNSSESNVTCIVDYRTES